MTKPEPAAAAETPDEPTAGKRSTAEIEANERILSARADREALEVERTRIQIEESILKNSKLREDILVATAQRQAQEVTTRATERLERESLASAIYQHIYHFTSAVDGRSVRECMARMDIWRNLDPGCDIEIVFSSPGGSVIDGMALFDYIQQMRKAGHKVTTSTIGYAASMAGILLQAGDVRRMGAEAYLLIHEVSTFTSGKIGEIEDEVAFLKKMQGRVLEIFAARSKSSDPEYATRKMTKGQIDKAWKRKDWWLDSAEALAHGFVDEIY